MPENDSINPDSGWTYNPDGNTVDPSQPEPQQPANESVPQKSITWTASEFIEVHKGASWHLLFYGGLSLLALIAYGFTKDYISAAVIIIAGIIFAITITRKPRQLSYEVNSNGIQIAGRFYEYGLFKSFDLVQEGGIKSISLMPLKRLMPDISLYFPPEQETQIVEVLSSHLPHDLHAEKSMDRLARKLRF